MPKETFFNLPTDKKNRIIETAYKLFLNHPYEEISISFMAKTAGIPVGSFYQYFDGLGDLFVYLIAEIDTIIIDEYKRRFGYYIFTREIIDLEELLTKDQLDLLDRVYTTPDDVMMKYYFDNHDDHTGKIFKEEITELFQKDVFIDGIDIDFVLHLYISSNFNVYTYLKKSKISDRAERRRIRFVYYDQIFGYGLFKKDQNTIDID